MGNLRDKINIIGMALKSSKSRSQINDEIDSLYTDYGITAKQYYDSGYHNMSLSDIEKKLDRRIINNIRIAGVCEQTGRTEADIRESMKRAKRELGITAGEYLSDSYYMHDDDLRSYYETRKAERAISHAEIQDMTDDLLKQTGIDEEELKKQMQEASANFHIGKKAYLKNGYYWLSINEMVRSARKRKYNQEIQAELSSLITEKTGKDSRVIKEEINRLRELYPDMQSGFYSYFENGFYLLDFKDDDSVRELADKVMRKQEIRQSSFRGDLSRWDEYLGLLSDTLSEGRKMQLLEQINHILPDMKLEDFQDIALDMQASKDLLGFYEAEYVAFHLWEKDLREKQEFISSRDRFEILHTVNPKSKCAQLDSKFSAYSLLGDHYGRRLVHVKSMQDYSKFRDFALTHDVFVKKGNYESIGRGIELVDTSDKCRLKEKYLELAEYGGFDMILEELIRPDEMFRSLNPDSVNTVRINSFRDMTGKVNVLFCSIRIGRAGSFVDNSGAGGVFIHIDKKTGVTDSPGMDEFGVKYETHPDHGYKLQGIQIPAWDKAIDLVEKLSLKVKDLAYFGWDLTYTADGEWVVVEGNTTPQFFGPQASIDHGVKEEFLSYVRPMFEKMLPDAELDPDRKEKVAEKWGVTLS